MPKTISRPSRKRSIIRILPRSWCIACINYDISLWRSNFRAILLEFLARIVCSWTGLRVFDFTCTVFGTHREGWRIFRYGVNVWVIVSWTRLKAISYRICFWLWADCYLWAWFSTVKIVLSRSRNFFRLKRISGCSSDSSLFRHYFQAGLCLPILDEEL